jgi:cytochrome c553
MAEASAATLRNSRTVRRSTFETLAQRRAELSAVVADGQRSHAANALALELLREATRAELAAWVAAQKRAQRRARRPKPAPANENRADLFTPTEGAFPVLITGR